MSTEFYNRNWRMPKSSNSNKVSNYSMTFDGGSSEQIEVSNDSGIDFTSAFSYSMWFKTTSSSNSYIIQHVGKFLIQIVPGTGTHGRVRLKVSDGSGTNTNVDYLPSTNVIIDGNWHHIVITSDGTNSTNGLKMYYDKTVVAQNTQTNSGTNAATQNLYIGSGETTNFFTGSIDHVAGFDYALSQSDVDSLYSNSTNGVGNPMSLSVKPKAYYPIGDYAAFNGSEYLVNNGALQDYVFDFDASNPDNISFGTGIGDIIGDNYTGGMAISLWFKTSVTSGHERGIFVFSTGNNNFGEITAYFIVNSLRVYVKNNTVLNYAFTDKTSWHNLLINFIGPSEDNQVYLDGAPIGSAFTYTDLDLNGKNLILGYTYSTFYDYQGEISNFQVWDTNLSSSEIATIYNNGTPYMGTQPQASNLKGWWKLDASATFDGSNWSIPDDSSNSNTGTSSGMTAANLVQSNLNITTPYSRYALSFDGSTNTEKINLNSNVNLGSQNTFSFWINRDSNTNDEVVLGGVGGDWVNNTIYLDGVSLYLVAAGSGIKSFGTIITEDAGTWIHICIVRNGDEANAYVNGSHRKQRLGLGTGDAFVDTIGASPTYALDFLTSKLSNVAIFNTNLPVTGTESVASLYNNGVPPDISSFNNLQGWWQLGENSSFDGTNWTVLDEKGTNNGTSANMGEDAIVNGVGTTGNGLSSGMGGADNIIGDAPYSTANAISYGMGVDAKSTSVPS